MNAEMNNGGAMMNKMKVAISPAEVKRYGAEAVAAFILCMIVVLVSQSNLAILTPLLAGLALGLSVYTIGSISGAHANPAVTLGALSIGKISIKDAVGYIVGQFIGAAAALSLAAYFAHHAVSFVLLLH